MRVPKAGLIVLSLLLLAASAISAEVQNNPSDSSPDHSSPLDFANGLYARKMYGPAISEYEKFIQSNPNSPELASARFRSADSRYFTKDYSLAIAGFSDFIKTFPQDKRVAIARFRVGTAKFYLKNYAQAIRSFSQLSEKADDPTLRSGALFYLAKSLEAKNKFPKALPVFEKVIRSYPQSEYATYSAVSVGDYHMKEKNVDAAIHAYQIAADKKLPLEVAREAQFKVGEIYFFQKLYLDAKLAYQRLFYAFAGNEGLPQEGRKEPTLKEKALLGLFYCDFYLQDPDSAVKRYDGQKSWLEKSALLSEIQYLIACLLSDNKTYEAALNYLNQVIANPKAEDAIKEKSIFKKSQVLAATEKKDQALDLIKSLFEKKSVNQPKAYFERGQILKSMGRYPEAITAYESVPENDNGGYFRAARYELGNVYLQANQPEKAKESFSQIIAKFPQDEKAEKATLQLIQIELDAANFQDAMTNASKFIRDYPKSAYLDIATYKLGVSLTGLKQYQEASDAFKTVVNSYPSSKLVAESLFGAAASLENAGQDKEALKVYEKQAESFPDHELSKDVYSKIGALTVKVGDFNKAAGFYQDIILNKPKVMLGMDEAFWTVQYLLDNSRYEEMQKILAALPGRFSGTDMNHEINFFLGESAMGLKDYKTAAEYYQKSITLKPKGSYAPHAYLGLGIAQSALGDPASSQKSLSEALKFDEEPKVTLRAHFETANMLLRKGDTLGAAKAFMLVAILFDDPKYSALSLYKAGRCFQKAGDGDEANKAFQELRVHYPQSEWAKKASLASHGEPEN